MKDRFGQERFSHSQNMPQNTQPFYQPATLSEREEKQLVTYNHISYFLYAIAPFSLLATVLIAVIMNYTRRDRAGDSWLATHFDWQIKTFWYSFLGFAFSAILILIGMASLVFGVFASSVESSISAMVFFGLGGLVFVVVSIWYLYRLVCGWVALNDGREVS